MINNSLESLTKAGAAAAAICYVTGLIVTNLYLRSFAFADFSLVRTRYIVTGLTAIGFLMLVGGLVHICFQMLRRALPRAHWEKRRLRIHPRPLALRSLGMAFVSLVLLAMFLLMAMAVLGAGLPNNMDSVARLFSASAIAVLLFESFRGLVKEVPTTRSGIEQYRRRQAMKAHLSEVTAIRGFSFDSLYLTWLILPMFFAFVALAYFSVYAIALYPLLPDQLGGGRPRNVQFVMNQGFETEASALGFVVVPNTAISYVVPLLWESDTQYLVGLTNGYSLYGTVQVNKSLVAGIYAPIPLALGKSVAAMFTDVGVYGPPAPAPPVSTPEAHTPIMLGN